MSTRSNDQCPLSSDGPRALNARGVPGVECDRRFLDLGDLIDRAADEALWPTGA